MEKIFKKSLALVLSAALCLTALVGCLTVSAEGASATVTVGSVEVNSDATTAKVPVTITASGDGIAAAMFELKVDTTKINLSGLWEDIATNIKTESDSIGINVSVSNDGDNVTTVASEDVYRFIVEGVDPTSGENVSIKQFTNASFDLTFNIASGATGENAIEFVKDAHAQACNAGKFNIETGKFDGSDEALVPLTGTNGKVTVASADTEVNVTFRHNINFASKLDILFAVPTSSFADCESVYIVVEKELYDTTGAVTGTETTTINEYDSTSLSGHYAFYYGGTLAKEMGSKVTAVVYGVKADGTKVYTQRDNYSVLDYVKNRLSKTTNEKEKTALVNLMDYGTAAQNYFKYNTSNLVIDSIDSSFLSYRGTLDESVVTDAFTSTPNDGATVTLRKNMSFASSIEIIVGFVTSATDLKVKFDYTDINGSAQTLWVNSDQFKTDSGLTYASFTAFTALEMDKVVTATLYSGDSPISDTITYSVYSYSSTRLARTDAFGTLIREMVKYGQSVKAFKNK